MVVLPFGVGLPLGVVLRTVAAGPPVAAAGTGHRHRIAVLVALVAAPDTAAVLRTVAVLRTAAVLHIAAVLLLAVAGLPLVELQA